MLEPRAKRPVAHECQTQRGESARAVVRADRRNRGLVALGLVLITLFMAGLVLSRTVGSTTTEHTTAAPCPAGSQPACSTEQTKATKTKNFPSESLLTVLLFSGGLLVLIGALYGRITSIKAFGAEIGLAPAETNKLVEKVTERMQGSRAEEVAEVLPAALNQARGLGVHRGGTSERPGS